MKHVNRRQTGLYGRVRNILESARAGAARSVNTAQVIANWMIGREIVEEEQKGRARAGYAETLIEQLSERLTVEYGAGFSVQNLWYMRQFYAKYGSLLGENDILHALRGELKAPEVNAVRPASKLAGSDARRSERTRTLKNIGENAILHALRGEFGVWKPGLLNPGLSWTHYRTLLKVERDSARAFYEIEVVNNAWSARELERQIGSLLFERLARSRDKKGLLKLASEGHRPSHPIEIFKDPTVIEFLALPESHNLTESKLEQLLIDNLRTFLMEMGSGFAFVGRQQRITLDGDHFYIDLVFYHTVLKCYVLVDLKVGKLTHADLGQIQFYANYFDRERRTEGDNPTIGLILCTDKNEAVVRYTLGGGQDRKIFTSKYQLHLPQARELEKRISLDVREFGVAPSKKAVSKKALPPGRSVKRR